MKKQISLILILTAFTTTYTLGQINTVGDVSVKPACTGTESTPATDGTQYIYKVTIPPGTPNFTGSGTYDWYVTQNTDLLAGPIIADGGPDFTASGGYNGETGNANQIGISWSSTSVKNGKPYYLVIKYNESVPLLDPCNRPNIRVYRIMPKNSFWLRMESAISDGTSELTYTYCPSPISSAIYTEASSSVEYKYGTKAIYALITAGGYNGNWNASLQLSNLIAGQTIASIDWKILTDPLQPTGSFTAPAASIVYGGVNVPSGVWTGTLPATITDTQILVTINLDNNFHQGLDDQPIKIAIDGTITTGVGFLDDLSDVNGACTSEDAFADYVISTVKARPGITPVTPATFANAPSLIP